MRLVENMCCVCEREREKEGEAIEEDKMMDDAIESIQTRAEKERKKEKIDKKLPLTFPNACDFAGCEVNGAPYRRGGRLDGSAQGRVSRARGLMRKKHRLFRRGRRRRCR